jgi:hypothetical protein
MARQEIFYSAELLLGSGCKQERFFNAKLLCGESEENGKVF